MIIGAVALAGHRRRKTDMMTSPRNFGVCWLPVPAQGDVLGDGCPTQKSDILFYLSKETFNRPLIDDLWQVKAATSAKSLGAVILSDTVVDQIRKELRRQPGHNVEPGHNVDPTELSQLIKSGVLRPDCL
jgi:hypothetical protein